MRCKSFVCKTVKVLWLLVFLVPSISAASGLPKNRVSDITNTRHNLSAGITPDLPGNGARNVQARYEQQICIFCHTPHGAEQIKAPLWNRKFLSTNYTTYSSSSLDASDLGQPTGTSKLCLSCHDGTMAIGAVNVLNGTFTDRDPKTQDIEMVGVGLNGEMPAGHGTTSGFTRNLGIDLTNDHPISFTYDSDLALRDGELRNPANVDHIATRSPGVVPEVPLENGQVQCNSCHDPHIRDKDNNVNIKFLRLNRFQQTTPGGGAFEADKDIICLACHDKAGWAGSAHANSGVGNEQYKNAAADLREFPQGTRVWQAACLNCHDTHTVQGSRRLLREGTSDVGFPKQGGGPAIEETCWMCHSSDGNVLLSQGFNTEVPDIKTDFTTIGNTHMPITSDDQPNPDNTVETHDIGTGGTLSAGKDFMESQAKLGKTSAGGSLSNRHVECTDCHNPHRVIKNRLFNSDPHTPDNVGTHPHSITDIQANNPDGVHTNIASGVLRGMWGVEPKYNFDSFYVEPYDFEVKRGDPRSSGTTNIGESYVTREYQICLKCHSNYGYDTPPDLSSFTGGTVRSTNSLLTYTNQAREFQTPSAHKGEGTAPDGGAFKGVDAGGNNVDYEINNHRGWHPVIDATDRTAAVRNADAALWLSPFDLGVGTQTMYCSDCHGSATSGYTAEPVGGDNGNPWGPHGSSNNFILKGRWDDQTGNSAAGGPQTDALCFKCHNYDDYANPSNSNPKDSGFSGDSGMMCVTISNNLHIGHARCLINNKRASFRCSFCHVAVPHGWKNKALLVNLNDVGTEGGFASSGNQVRNGTRARYYNGPYYNGAVLKVRVFKRSGQWQAGNCGSAGAPGNGQVGRMWMAMGSEACSNIP